MKQDNKVLNNACRTILMLIIPPLSQSARLGSNLAFLDSWEFHSCSWRGGDRWLPAQVTACSPFLTISSSSSRVKDLIHTLWTPVHTFKLIHYSQLCVGETHISSTIYLWKMDMGTKNCVGSQAYLGGHLGKAFWILGNRTVVCEGQEWREGKGERGSGGSCPFAHGPLVSWKVCS